MFSGFVGMIESVMLVIALSIDAFVASFAYGAGKIKVPIMSAVMIDLVCTFILGVSLFLGKIIRPFIPDRATNIICFVIIFSIGVIKLFDSRLKAYIKKNNSEHKKLSFSFKNLNFIIDMYANPEKADKDVSKELSPTEAIPLALALSIDVLAVGLSAALTEINNLEIIFFSLIINIIMVLMGCFLGNKIAEKTKMDLSWVSGLILIILSILKL